MKKLWIALITIAIIAIPIAYYIFSTAFTVIELQEDSPIDIESTVEKLQIKDAMDTMDAATKAEFEKQVDAAKANIMVMDDVMPSGPKVISQGEFKPRAHDVKGKSLLISKNGENILRFEDFETINGPDLRIYLSSELGNDDFIELGKIKATKGNVNYDIPAGTDLSKYKFVLVWCKPFGVLFSYAELA